MRSPAVLPPIKELFAESGRPVQDGKDPALALLQVCWCEQQYKPHPLGLQFCFWPPGMPCTRRMVHAQLRLLTPSRTCPGNTGLAHHIRPCPLLQICGQRLRGMPHNENVETLVELLASFFSAWHALLGAWLDSSRSRWADPSQTAA